jgi:hypothetical protein
VTGALAGITYRPVTRMEQRFVEVESSTYRQKYRKFVKCRSCSGSDTA